MVKVNYRAIERATLFLSPGSSASVVLADEREFVESFVRECGARVRRDACFPDTYWAIAPNGMMVRFVTA